MIRVITQEAMEQIDGQLQAPDGVVNITTTEQTPDGPLTATVQVAQGEPGPTQVVLLTEIRQAVVAISEAGVPGPPGPPGPAGVDAQLYTQDIPALTWVIPHTFDHFPVVWVYDTGNNRVAVSVHQDLHQVTIQLDYPLAGRAYLI